MRRDAPGRTACTRSDPEIATIHKCNFVFTNIRETQQTALLHFLCGREASTNQDKTNHKERQTLSG
jgi:hypothetical protein